MQRLRTFLLALTVAGIGVFALILPTRADEAVSILDIKVTPSADAASISWNTDVTATGTLEYGTQPGVYTGEATTSSGIAHDVRITGLTAETRYYFRITVVGIDETEAQSDEQTFVTESKTLQFKSVQVVTAGSDKMIVEATLNQGASATLKYGTAADSLTMSGKHLTLTSGTGAATWSFSLTNLQASTTYYYQVTATQSEFWHGQDASAASDVLSAATTAKPTITSVKPRSGKSGTRVVIKGEHFGRAPKKDGTTGIVTIGCTLGSWPASAPACATRAKDIVSWSDSKIVIKVNKRMSTGRVYVGKAYQTGFGSEVMYAIRGPKFLVY